MTVCERGDVVLVPFPFSDQSTTKKRPAVVISSNGYNSLSPDIVIMAITSQTEKTVGIGEYLIKNWSGAGLLKPSSIKPAVSTIEKKLVLKKLGKLSYEDMRKEGQVSTFDKLAFHLLYFIKNMKEQGDYHSSHDL